MSKFNLKISIWNKIQPQQILQSKYSPNYLTADFFQRQIHSHDNQSKLQNKLFELQGDSQLKGFR